MRKVDSVLETIASEINNLNGEVNSIIQPLELQKTFLDKSKSLDKYLPKGKSRRPLKVENCGIGNPQRILFKSSLRIYQSGNCVA